MSRDQYRFAVSGTSEDMNRRTVRFDEMPDTPSHYAYSYPAAVRLTTRIGSDRLCVLFICPRRPIVVISFGANGKNRGGASVDWYRNCPVNLIFRR